MKRFTVTLVLACAALVVAAPGQAAINVGVADDHPVGTADGGAAFFAVMNDVGLREVRLSVLWDPTQPTTIVNQASIDAVLPVATLRGVKIVFSVAPLKARAMADPASAGKFVAFVEQVARTHPTVKDVIVGNEPNQPRFWQPQFDSRGRNVSGAAYEAVLAASYDVLKAVDPSINVIGVGLSPRGNDNPRASGNVSTSPVKFLQAVGKAYRASRRRKPLMDEFAYHPYPKKDTDAFTDGYPWPNAGVTNLDRVKQAFWDAFGGTAQPTFEQRLKVKLDEVGWQVAVPPSAAGSYFGAESIAPTTEAAQATNYAGLLRYVACDPAVDSVLFFGLQDEPNLDRWQAGLMRADGTKRPSYDAVKSTIAQTGGNCPGRMRSWRHTTVVDGAKATFRRDRRLPSRVDSWSFLASADEDAVFDAGIYRLRGGHRGARALSETGRLDAHLTRYVRFRARRLRPGRYVYSIRFRAAANLGRVTRKTSRPFVIYRAR
ncbi:MAG TPA: hypothetical protein VH420_05035 [Gaiellaceae bacterium]